MEASTILKYQQLIKRFLDCEIDGLAFEHYYLELFKNDESPLVEELYEVLNTLFYAVDDFVADPQFLEELRLKGDMALGEPELRRECRRAYEQLEALRLRQAEFG